MSDDELDRLVKYLQTAPSMAARNAATAITTLRARIAELESERSQNPLRNAYGKIYFGAP